jgi:hypothetical protein
VACVGEDPGVAGPAAARMAHHAAGAASVPQAPTSQEGFTLTVRVFQGTSMNVAECPDVPSSPARP